MSIYHRLSSDPHPVKISQEVLQTIKARSDAKRTRSEKIADWMTSTFGSMTFLIGNAVVFFFLDSD